MFKNLIQIPIDLLVGLAVYFFVTTFFSVGTNAAIIVALTCTAIFAEVFEIGIKSNSKKKEN